MTPVVQSSPARARGLRLAAAAAAALAALLLAAAIVLNESAVNLENRITGDSGSYPAGLALALAALAAGLAGLSAARGPSALLVLAARRPIARAN